MADPANIGRREIETALRENDGKIGEAARALDVDRRTLMRRMRVLGMPKGKAGRRYRRLGRGKHRTAIGLGLGAAAVGALIFGANKLRGSST